MVFGDHAYPGSADQFLARLKGGRLFAGDLTVAVCEKNQDSLKFQALEA